MIMKPVLTTVEAAKLLIKLGFENNKISYIHDNEFTTPFGTTQIDYSDPKRVDKTIDKWYKELTSKSTTFGLRVVNNNEDNKPEVSIVRFTGQVGYAVMSYDNLNDIDKVWFICTMIQESNNRMHLEPIVWLS